MDITIFPQKLTGSLSVLPSKSQAHRLLICAALADRPTELHCPQTNRDIEATADCLRSLGAEICRTSSGYCITPIREVATTALLPCAESGSTLRFLLPLAGALGVDATFQMEGRLPQRPLSPLWEELERMGCTLSRPDTATIHISGRLRPGDYAIAGNVSSQFVTGLLLALSVLDERSTLTLTGTVESAPYIEMTLAAMARFGAAVPREEHPFRISPASFRSPGRLMVEGDWSNGAFWLAAQALGSHLDIRNLDPDSPQGDRACAHWIPALRNHQRISARDIPDLVPILSVVAAANQGAVFTDIQRLRIKESDRVEAVIQMLSALGGRAEATEDTLTVHGTGLRGGRVDAMNDHRIAMAAAIASTVCTGPVTILGARCVEKSYPQFWAEFARLGGNYEQHLR